MGILTMSDSPTMNRYRNTLKECISLYMPQAPEYELDTAINYSIAKRYDQANAQLVNTYSGKSTNKTLLQFSDYIMQREPIVTAFGTMFSKHANARNPLAEVVQEFLDKRSEDKAMMFKFPKGSEEFEYYNLLQQLDKIDCNGIYGILGMYTSMVFNINVATSITSQGRSLISSAIMQFEMLLANNVKFGSLTEVMEFINHIVKERPIRKYRDEEVLDNPYVTPQDCFVKVVMTCGYRWIPSEEEMEIIWRTINNLSQEDINRVYYKNNLYEFMSNSCMIKAVRYILNKLDEPFMNPLKPPKNIIPELDEFVSLLMEYVYYGYQIIDRIDRAEHMIRSVVMISDTDSAIVSLDAWYRFILGHVKDMDLKFVKPTTSPLFFYEKDEFGDIVDKRYHECIYSLEPEYDFDFFDDKLIEMKHAIDPIVELPQDHLRHTILNILAYALDKINNDYMERYTKNNHSFADYRKCKIILKNEFTFRRVLLTAVKKNYASLQELQEGNLVPVDKELDVKGIECMAKSSKAKSTREALKKILLEDILKTDVVDQFVIIKKIAILERKIIDSLYDGSREFYKPATIKAATAYKDPMRIQGIKGAVVWNELNAGDAENINMEERNAVDIAKVNINPSTIEKIKDDYPEVYERARNLLNQDQFKGQIDSISIPLDIQIPGWVLELIDHNTIVNDNIGGFVYESVGIRRLGKTNLNYTNMLQL